MDDIAASKQWICPRVKCEGDIDMNYSLKTITLTFITLMYPLLRAIKRKGSWRTMYMSFEPHLNLETLPVYQKRMNE